MHYNDYAARLQGAQIAYDVGIQRTCWQIHQLTNWMGDSGFLRHVSVEIRRHNPVGDTLYLNGEVTRVFAEDGTQYAEITQTAVNQDGELSVRAKGSVRLPSRAQR